MTRPGHPRDMEPASTDASGTERRRARLLRRALIGLGAALVVLLVAVAGGTWYLTHRYGSNIERVPDVFAGLDGTQRPPPPPAEEGAAPLTFMVVGSDTRAGTGDGTLPGGRSDVMMLLRISGDRQRAQVVSLPRDSWVFIPGVGLAKLNAAYAYGGPSLLVQTVESMTGVRIDHFAAIDFQGFVTMTDALGGVDVQVAATTATDSYTFQAGWNHLDGEGALLYVRQRYELPGGDLDRVRRQQQYLRAMFDKLSQQDVLGDAASLDAFLLALSGAMSVDEELSTAALVQLAFELRSLNPGSISFLTVPVAGTGMEGAQSVVYLEEARANLLWAYLRADSLADHVAEFGAESLPDVPR